MEINVTTMGIYTVKKKKKKLNSSLNREIKNAKLFFFTNEDESHLSCKFVQIVYKESYITRNLAKQVYSAIKIISTKFRNVFI